LIVFEFTIAHAARSNGIAMIADVGRRQS